MGLSSVQRQRMGYPPADSDVIGGKIDLADLSFVDAQTETGSG